MKTSIAQYPKFHNSWEEHWTTNFNKNWLKGICACSFFSSVNGEPTTHCDALPIQNEPPMKCPYLLEQMLQGQEYVKQEAL